jgi:hypothetical protein
MRHIKPYGIFEGESPSDYTILGIYDPTNKEGALSRLRELSLEAIAANITGTWNGFFPDSQLFILRDPAGRIITVALPENLEKRIHNITNGKYFQVTLDDVFVNSYNFLNPEEIRGISSALSYFISDDYIISHIKANPLDQDLLNGHPKRDELIRRSGVKDVSSLADMMRKGLI